MASTEIVVLHGSPPHQERDKEPITTPPAFQYVPNSSSSDGSSLPSVSKLWTKWDSKQQKTAGAGASRVSPLPLDSRLKGGSHAGALPTNASFGFQSVKGIIGRKELSIEEEMVEVQDGKLEGGKTKVIKETGDAMKPKKPRAPAKKKTKSKDEEDPGTEKEVKAKAKRKSRAKVVTVDTEGTVSNHFGQSTEGQAIGAEESHDLVKEVKPKAKRKSRAKPVVSTHFDQNNATGEHGATETEKKAAPVTKKRKRKDVDDTVEKPKPVKRASKEDKAKAPKSRNKTGKASTHFATGDISEGSKMEVRTASVMTEPHDSMDIAEKRRKSWTPVPDTAPAQLKMNGHDIYEVPSSSQPPTPVGAKPDFRSMIGSFGFDSRSVTRSASPEKVDVVGLNKRRRIEVCHVSNYLKYFTDKFSSLMIRVSSPRNLPLIHRIYQGQRRRRPRRLKRSHRRRQLLASPTK